MITSNQKISAIARDLADRLKVRMGSSATINTVRAALDANGAPMLFLSVGGNEAAGQPVILIRLKQVSMVSPDIFGNAALAYCPSVSQLCYELDANGKPLPNQKDLDIAKWELFRFGVRYQQVEIAKDTAVSEASSDAAVPALDLDQLYWPTKGA